MAFLMLGGKSHPAFAAWTLLGPGPCWFPRESPWPCPRSSFGIRGYEPGSYCGLCWGSIAGGHADSASWTLLGMVLPAGLLASARLSQLCCRILVWRRSPIVVGQDRSAAVDFTGCYFDVIATRRPGTGGLDGWRIRPAPLSSSCTRAPGYTASAKAKIERKLFLKWSILA